MVSQGYLTKNSDSILIVFCIYVKLLNYYHYSQYLGDYIKFKEIENIKLKNFAGVIYKIKGDYIYEKS